MNFKQFLSTFFLLFCFSAVWGQASIKTQNLANAIRTGDLTSVQDNYSDEAVTGIDPVSKLHPLHLACKLNQKKLVEFLLRKESSMESGIYVSNEEMPPMLHAIKEGHTEIIQLLLDKGNRHPNGNWMGKTYLFHAYDMNADKVVIDLLVKNGADIKRAQRQAKIDDSKVLNIEQAQKWTTEISIQLDINKYQAIDIWNLNVRSSNMLAELEAKYGINTPTVQAEAQEILAYRVKKLKLILSPSQIKNLGTLSAN